MVKFFLLPFLLLQEWDKSHIKCNKNKGCVRECNKMIQKEKGAMFNYIDQFVEINVAVFQHVAVIGYQ